MSIGSKLENWIAEIESNKWGFLKRLGKDSFIEAYSYREAHKAFKEELLTFTDKPIRQVDNQYYLTFVNVKDLFGLMKKYRGQVTLDKLNCFYDSDKDIVSVDACLTYWSEQVPETAILSHPLFGLLEKLFEAEEYGLNIERDSQNIKITDKENRVVSVKCEVFGSQPTCGAKIVRAENHVHYLSEDLLKVLYTLWYSWMDRELAKPRLRKKHLEEVSDMELFRQFGT